MGSILKKIIPTVPKSTDNLYNFDPQLINKWRPVKFDSGRTGFRVSKEEIGYLQAKMLQNGGSSLKTAQILWLLRRVFLVIWIVISIWRLVVLCVDKDKSDHSENVASFVACLIGILAFVILLRMIGDMFAQKASKQIRAFLNQQNAILYSKRGLGWRINSTCRYMQLGMDEGVTESMYQPPSVEVERQSDIIRVDDGDQKRLLESEDKLN